jgi:hypothetical protein
MRLDRPVPVAVLDRGARGGGERLQRPRHAATSTPTGSRSSCPDGTLAPNGRSLCHSDFSQTRRITTTAVSVTAKRRSSTRIRAATSHGP